MPPRQSAKRRGADDEHSSERNPKKMGKHKREMTYDTYEEALDGGVDFEEKAERYRDGERAQRNYERALELYRTAFEKQQTYDAAYNQARTLYTLATSFLLPPNAQQYLYDSIDLYRHSINATDSSALKIDAGFNLGQSCSSLADILEDVDPQSGPQIRQLRDEAINVLTDVLNAQLASLASMSEDADIEVTEEGVNAAAEAPTADEEGQMDVEVDQDSSGDQATFETHLPTPSTTIDTVLALVDLHLTNWETAEPLQLPNDEQQQAVRTALDQGAQMCPSGRQAELFLAEIKVLLAMDEIVWDLYKEEAQPGKGLEQSLLGAAHSLSKLFDSLETQPPDEASVRADILTVLAETYSKIGYRQTFLAIQLPPGPSPLAQGSWFHHSQAVTYLNQTLNLPAIAGTPKEFKPSILLRLSTASLSRARLASVNETAQRNLRQLVENADNYVCRAGEALGMPWIRAESAQNAKVELPTPSGWDAESLGREIVLQRIRTCLYASEMDLDIQLKGKLNESMSQLLLCLKGISASDRRVGERDIERLLEDIEENEEGASDLERGWWAKVLAVIQP